MGKGRRAGNTQSPPLPAPAFTGARKRPGQAQRAARQGFLPPPVELADALDGSVDGRIIQPAQDGVDRRVVLASQTGAPRASGFPGPRRERPVVHWSHGG